MNLIYEFNWLGIINVNYDESNNVIETRELRIASLELRVVKVSHNFIHWFTYDLRIQNRRIQHITYQFQTNNLSPKLADICVVRNKDTLIKSKSYK